MALDTTNRRVLVTLEMDEKDYLRAIKKVEAADERKTKAVQRNAKKEAAAHDKTAASIAKIGAAFFTIEKAIGFAKQAIDRFIASGAQTEEQTRLINEATKAWQDMQEGVGRLVFELGDGVLVKAFTGVSWAIRDMTDAITGFNRAEAEARKAFEKRFDDAATLLDKRVSQLVESRRRLQMLRDQIANKDVTSAIEVGRALANITKLERKIPEIEKEVNDLVISASKRMASEAAEAVREREALRKESAIAIDAINRDAERAAAAEAKARAAEAKARAAAALLKREQRRGFGREFEEGRFAPLHAEAAAAEAAAAADMARMFENNRRISDREFQDNADRVAEMRRSAEETKKFLESTFSDFSSGMADAFAQSISGAESFGAASRRAIAGILDALAWRASAEAGIALASGNVPAFAAYTAAAATAKTGAAILGRSSSAGAAGGTWRALAPGALVTGGNGSGSNITVVVGSSFGNDPVRVRQQKIQRAIREAGLHPDSDTIEFN